MWTEVRTAPQSYEQERFYLFDTLEQGAASTLALIYWITGELDTAALAEAISLLHARHEVLRTRYPGLSTQEVLPPGQVPVEQLDLRTVADPDTEVRRLVDASMRRLFDLSDAPPVRWQCCRLAADRFALTFVVHHIATDGWSKSVIEADLAELYDAVRAGRPPRLPDLPISYADYATAERDHRGVERMRTAVDRWVRELDGLSGPTVLPFDRPPTVETGFGGRISRYPIDDAVYRAAERLGRQEHASPFMVLLAGFAWQLRHWGDQRDFVVGVPVAGRSQTELESVVGCFVDTLPLRLCPDGEPTFRELLVAVRDTALDGYESGCRSLERVVAALRPERVPGREPLVQVTFGSTDISDERFGLTGTEVTGESRGAVAVSLELAVIIATGADGVEGLWEYKTELFDESTIRRSHTDFVALLRWATAQPDTPLTEFANWSDEPTPVDRARLPGEWTDTGPATAMGSVPELFAEQARRTPDRIALTYAGEHLSYAELNARANRLARLLIEHGAGPEQFVALALPRSLDLVVAVLAVLKSGAAYLPLDLDLPAERVRTMLRDAEPVLLIGDAPGGIPRLAMDDPALARQDDTNLAPRCDPDHPAYLIYTSGSTGTPKGVIVPHRNVIRLFAATRQWFDFDADDVWALFHSYAFDFSVWEIWGALLHGGRLVVVPHDVSRMPEEFLRLLENERVTVLNQTPSAFYQLMRAERDNPARHSLRYVVFGGEELDPRRLGEWYERHADTAPVLVNMYGITETTVHVSHVALTAEFAARATESVIGAPIPDLRVYIVDGEGRPVPPGVTGELFVAGAGLARGYFNRPGLTAERFLPDPFGEPGSRMYRSGDLARWTGDGWLRFCGRVDDQVKIRGFRVELGEIQRALTACPGVAQAVVVAREDRPGDKRLVAYLIAAATAVVPSADELRERLAKTLPDYMVPSAYLVLESFPLTRTGKLDRRALPAPARPAGTPPRTDSERLVARIWCEILELPSVGVDDNFFELGGHSLVAARIVARLGEVFPGLPVRGLMRDVLRSPTIAAFVPILAEWVLEQASTAGASGPPPLSPVPRGATVPLSLGQKRLWFLDQFVSDSAEYLVPILLRINGELDLRALVAALTEIVRRHEVLRTSVVVVVDDEPAGVVRAADRLSVPTVDVAEADLVATVDREAIRPLDLEHGLPVRATVFRVDDTDHVLCVTFHHMVFDGSSIGLFHDELGALYGAFADGRPSPLAPLTVQYADVTSHQEARWAGPEFAAKVDFWRTELDGAEPFELATDLPRHARRTAPGATHDFTVPADHVAGLERIAQRHGATLFMVLLAAWQVLLHRWSGAEDIVVGTTADERELPQTEPLLGLFINMLVLRGDLSGNPSFVDLLVRTRDRTLDAYANQDLPFDRLVEELAPSRDLGRTPIFQVMIKLGTASQRGPRLPGLAVRELAPPEIPAKYDIEFGFSPTDGALAGSLTYDTGLYRSDTIDRLLGHLGVLLGEISRDPTCPIDQFVLIDERDRERLRRLTERVSVPLPAQCLHELVSAQAARTPEGIAVVQEDRALTYAELESWSEEVAGRLVEQGVGPDAVVGVILDRSVEMVVALLGVLKAGGAYLPIEPDTPPARVAQLLADSDARVCLGEPDLSDIIAAAGARPLTVPARSQARTGGRTLPTVDPDHLVSVYYTSGSTGRPKGVASTHAGWVNRMRWMQRHHPLAAGDTVLHKTTLTFDDAAVEIFWPLLSGATVAVLGAGSHRDPRAIADAVIRYRAVHVQFVPSVLELFLEALTDTDVRDMAALRSVLSSGEALRPELVRRFRELFGDAVVFDNTWGTTEVSIDSTCRVCTEQDADSGRPAVSLGLPIDNNEVWVLDPWGDQVPVGIAGEIHVGGVGLARGYLNDPRRTAEAFVPHPELPGERLYRTGDWGVLASDGSLTFLRRRDDQVKIRGVRVELGEVEHVLRAHHAVADVVVTAHQVAPGDKRLAAYVVTSSPVAELFEHTRAHLAGYAVPSSITALDRLPRLPNGKLDRRGLPEPETSQDSDSYVAPRTPTEQAVADIWASVLGRDRVGAHDDFFVVGGHSLLATRAIARLRQAFATELPLLLMFDRPTVARVAEAIEEIVLAEISALSDDQAQKLLG